MRKLASREQLEVLMGKIHQEKLREAAVHKAAHPPMSREEFWSWVMVVPIFLMPVIGAIYFLIVHPTTASVAIGAFVIFMGLCASYMPLRKDGESEWMWNERVESHWTKKVVGGIAGFIKFLIVFGIISIFMQGRYGN